MADVNGSTRDHGPLRQEIAPYRREVDEVLHRLDVDRSGLDAGEAARRREEHGPNRIREQEQIGIWEVLLDQFKSPLIYVLLGALVATLAIQSYADAIVVGMVLAINGTIGFTQEYRAQTAVHSLMDMVSPGALVRRDGEEHEIDAEDVVPGDVVLLREGEVVPADVRLFETASLRVDESALTGESVPVDKTVEPVDEENLPPADQRNMAFMGTAVTSGEGVGLVVATGSATEIGKISEDVAEAGVTQTPLERRIQRLATWITIGVLSLATLAFLIGVLLGRGVTDMLLLAVALAVAAIPAGLPIVVTVALAIGVHRMAQRHAVIRQLPAVDTLGSCTTIVSDKTGTLTQNRMTVRAVASGGRCFDVTDEDEDEDEGEDDDEDDDDGGHGDGHGDGGPSLRHDGDEVRLDDHAALRRTLLVGVLCNDASLEGRGDDGAEEASGDPMEVALLVVGRTAGMERDEMEARYPQRDKIPFETEKRYMATVHDVPHHEGGGPLVLVKGAPERIAEMCTRRLTDDGEEVPVDAVDVIDTSEELAGAGLRVLAMATGDGTDAAETVREDPHDLVFVGMQGLLDPPRGSAVGAVDRCHGAGIRVLMVTGDHSTTASAISRQVHIDRPPDRPASSAGDETGGGDEGAEAGTVLTGQEVADLSDSDLDEALRRTNVFARFAPNQKLRIVERLKEADEIVAVTGDGVNDAPALQSAHLGAAMGSGTDVAKDASDMVITDDDFASVYAAVEEGRTAFRNIRMATFFLLSSGVAEVLLIITALTLDWPLPLLPAQILWLNVVTNGIADVALAFEPGEEELFRRAPRATDEGLLDARLLERLAIVGVWLAAASVGVFWWQWEALGADITTAQTATLTALVLFKKVHVFNCRAEDVSIFRKNLFSNKMLLIGVPATLGIHIGAMHLPWTQELLGIEPLDARSWAVAIGVAATAIIVNEAHKLLRPRPSGTSRDE
jgi:cation-transporting P-type ATPase F